MQEREALLADQALVLRTKRESDLNRIVETRIQAVIYEPDPSPTWLAALAAAVESGKFTIPRTVLPHATANDIATWLAEHVRDSTLTPDIREALLRDVLGLVAKLGNSTGATHFMMRIFTDAPTTECGFHVDTVPSGAPPWGFLRVYNGAGTAFVEPDNVTSISEFYRYLGRRERLERERRDARHNGDNNLLDRLEREICGLDDGPSFLKRPNEIYCAPPGSIVAFKHLDAGLHWTSHGTAKAWIHCSPMHGVARLVVNVTSPDASLRWRR
jgi:Protein of unknown function (DUF1826)